MELGRRDGVLELCQTAVELALSLTGSSQAVLALDKQEFGGPQLFSRVADRSYRLTDAEAADLLAGAGIATSPPRHFSPAVSASIRTELQTAGAVFGALAVARPSDYSETDRQAFAIFASQAAHALDGALMRQRDEESRSRIAERLRSAERVERAHELAVEVLLAVSSHAVAGQSLSDFYRRLAGTVAELVAAEKVLFWHVDDDRMLSPAGGFGVDDAFLVRLAPIRCEPLGEDLASQVVYRDLIFRANSTEEFAEFEYVLRRLSVTSAISVPWRAGEKRLGLVAAYDSRQADGFSREDTWVLQKAGLAAGLV